MGLDISGVGTFGQGKCEANVSAGGVTASAVCGTTSQNGDVCRAEASVSGVTIVTPDNAHTIEATGLSTEVETTCCTFRSSSSVASLTIDGETYDVGSESERIEVDGLLVIVNLENFSCGNGDMAGRVRLALWVVYNGFSVRAAYSQASSGPCPC